jgi:omega-amidase
MSTLRFTLIQSNLYWENVASNLAMFTEKIDSISEKTEVVVLPEMFTTGFSMQPEKLAEKMDGSAINWMRKMAIQHKIIISGSLIIEEHNQYFNRLIWMLPNGTFGYYDKRHLFGFAGENEYYTSGNKRLIAQVNGLKINLQICYDLRFPVWARQTMIAEKSAEYDVLIYVANWPEKRNLAWKTLLAARAIENQCYVIGVNRVGTDGNNIYYSGDSCIITPLGETIFTEAHKESIFTTTIDKAAIDTIRQQLPFLKDADAFSFIQQP